MDNEPIIIERTFNALKAAVWRAIVNRDEMKNWYFDVEEFKPEVGFEFQFTGGPPERQYLHLCRITEVIPGRTLKHSWRYDGYEGISFVTFELFDAGGKTLVRLTHEGLDSFPKDNPDFARKNFEIGWTAIIGTSLKDFVESHH